MAQARRGAGSGSRRSPTRTRARRSGGPAGPRCSVAFGACRRPRGATSGRHPGNGPPRCSGSGSRRRSRTAAAGVIALVAGMSGQVDAGRPDRDRDHPRGAGEDADRRPVARGQVVAGMRLGDPDAEVDDGLAAEEHDVADLADPVIATRAAQPRDVAPGTALAARPSWSRPPGRSGRRSAGCSGRSLSTVASGSSATP